MRTLIIEDDSATAHYICNGFKEIGYVCAWCSDGLQGQHRALTEFWDFIVLDRMLPQNVDGLTIIDALRKEGKNTPVLVLSALSSLDDRVQGLRRGGDDYLTKPFAFQELLARCDALLRRSAMHSEPLELRVADLRLDLRTHRVERNGKTIPLQAREFRLLEYLMRHAGQVVTRSMLFESVWEYHFDPQTNVIDVQISRLRQKIDKGFSPQLLHTVRGTGYMVSVND